VPGTDPAAPATNLIPGLDNLIPGNPTTPAAGAEPPADPVNPEIQAEAEAVMKLIQEKKYPEAIEMLEKAKAKYDDDAGVYFLLGSVYRMNGDLDEALAAFSKSLELSPENGDAYLRRGIIWYYKGEYAIAILDFGQAAALVYADPRPEFWRGACFTKLDQPRLAIQAYSLALKYNPNYIPARVNRGLAYLSLDEFTPALIDFQETIRLNPSDPTSYFKRGVAYARQGRGELAAKSFSEAIRLDPKYAAAYFNRGVAYQELGKGELAAKDRAEALKLQPDLKAGS